MAHTHNPTNHARRDDNEHQQQNEHSVHEPEQHEGVESDGVALARFVAGDPDGLAVLVARYGRLLHWTAWRVVSDDRHAVSRRYERAGPGRH